jgi:hypothetical protein
VKAYYDLKRCPPTFDVVSFLMHVETERLRRGDDAVEIGILPGPVGGFRDDDLWPHSIAERIHMRDNVAAPMCRMLPSAIAVTVHSTRPAGVVGFGVDEYSMDMRFFVEAMRQGVRPLRPRADLPKCPDLITITLRECAHWSPRNSNLPEWIAAGRALRSDGFDVVFVRDTLFADSPIEDFVTDPLASRDLDARAALYRSAKCNLFVNNGPAAFAMACDAPMVMFKPTCESLGGCYSAARYQAIGVTPGGQMPGSPSHQRMIWCEDTVAKILNATRQFMEET